jgi:hypothetical protein
MREGRVRSQPCKLKGVRARTVLYDMHVRYYSGVFLLPRIELRQCRRHPSVILVGYADSQQKKLVLSSRNILKKSEISAINNCMKGIEMKRYKIKRNDTGVEWKTK